MNDRFKFRAWDKEQNIMFYDAEMTYDYPCEPRGCESSSFGCVLDDETYVVMQCTGLKDKNGKLIYEGDIVKGTSGVYWGNLIVYFNEQRATFYLDRCDKEYKELRFHSKNQEDNCYLEVIGNRYENPELLQECE